MIDFNYFNNKIIVTPNELKPLFLEKKSLNPRLNFKIFSLSSLQEETFGKVSEDAIIKLFELKKYNYFELKKYLGYIRKGIDLNFNNEIKEIYNYLINNHLINKDTHFKNLFNDKEVVFVGYLKEQNEIQHLIKELNLNKYSFIKIDDLLEQQDVKLYTFKSYEEELKYVLYQICDLLNKGIKASDIILITDVKNNKFHLEILSNEIGLKLNYKNSKSLYDTPIAKNIEKHIYEITKENIDEFGDLKNNDFLTIKNIFEAYSLYDNPNKYLNFKDILKDISIEDEISDGIQVINKLIFNPNKYIFHTDLNNHFYVKVAKNNDLIDDILKEQVGIDTSNQLNLLYNDIFKNFLNISNKLFLTFSEISSSNEETISYYYINKIKSKKELIISNNELDYEYCNALALSSFSHLDYKKKIYNEITESYYLYKNYFKELKKYDHSYKKIIYDFKENIEPSYSRIDLYYSCPFKYFCEKILRLGNYKDSPYAIYGTIIHKVFEDMYEDVDNFNYETAFNKAKDEFAKDLTDYELIFLDRLKLISKGIADRLIKEYKQSKIKRVEREYKINCKINDNITVVGSIDCMLIADDSENFTYQDNENIKRAIQLIDYKTNNTSWDGLYVYGINLQLPLYYYCIKNDEKFKNHEVVGMYYLKCGSDKLFDYDNYIYDHENFKETFKDTLKKGLTTDDINYFRLFEPTLYEEGASSKTVSSIKILKDGRFNGKGVNHFDENEVVRKVNEKNEIEEEIYPPLVKQHILNFYNALKNSDFRISPFKKSYSDELNSCAYCEYKDICFKQRKDERVKEKLFPTNGEKMNEKN